jgi:cysteine dioxygenase
MKTGRGNLPASLNKIIEAIENEPVMNNDQLTGFIKKAGLKKDDFVPFSKFDHPAHESYGRNRIYEGNKFSIYLMSWAKGDFTAVHSHGMAEWGAVYFFGEMDHRLFNVTGNNVVLEAKGVVPAGTIAQVRGSLIHAMGNIDSDPVMSLHIYGWSRLESNANNNSYVYELEKKLVRTTNGSAFLDMNEDLCMTTSGGLLTNRETLSDYLPIILPFYEKNGNHRMSSYIKQVIANPDLYLN